MDARTGVPAVPTHFHSLSQQRPHNVQDRNSDSPGGAAPQRLVAFGPTSRTRDGLLKALQQVGWNCSETEEPQELHAQLGDSPETLVLLSTRGSADLEQQAAMLLGSSEDTGQLADLPGRELFLHMVDRALEQASRRKHTIAILCIDLADPNANAAQLLEEDISTIHHQIAQRLRSSLRDRDVLGQVAGGLPAPHESALARQRFTLMIELRRAHDASNVARRLLEQLTLGIETSTVNYAPAFHVGISLFPQDVSDSRDLLALAEQAAMDARSEGPNSLRYSSDVMNGATLEMLSMETSLRRAIRDEEFEVYYQPKIEIATERIVGMEALVRWKHPDLGMISPAQFIPVAEDTGLIGPIGDWVLRRACSDTLEWQRAGLGPIRIAVNLSSVQFRDPDLFESVAQALTDTGFDPNYLELELTESMLMDDAEAAVGILKRFKEQGIHIAIDDFGTGYSSLAYLKRFPIDSLKIDRSFITEVNTNPDDASISTSIILMGRSLKLKVIAEGVETRSQLSFLRVMQCDEVQGFLFSPPVPARSAREMLERQVRAAA